MLETSTPTLTPDATTKVPAFQNNNPGNVELGALKSFILNQAGLANGLATLDENGKLNAAQIPANLDDVLVYGSYALLPAVGESGKLYITTDVNGSYYWNGTSYQMLNNSFVRYRGTVSSLPSNPVTGDWFIAASTFTEGGVTYTSGAIYLYNGSSWDDATAVFGQFVRKSDISQTLGPEIDKVPSNAAVNGAINALNTRVTNIEETIMGENEITVQYPDDGNYPSLMPNKVPSRALKFAEVPTLRGKSRAWNQLVPTASVLDKYAYSATDISAGKFKLTVTSVDDYARIEILNSYTVGHSYLVNIEITAPVGVQINSILAQSWQILGTTTANTKFTYSGVFTKDPNFSANPNFALMIPTTNMTVGATVDVSLILRDLTPIFPEGVPATVADCVKAIPDLLKYDAYDAGSLVDTVVSGARSKSRNLWDEVAEVGSIYLSTGQNESNGNFFRSKNYIPVGIGTYYFKNNSDEIYIYRYDSDKNYLGYTQFYGAGFSFSITGETRYIRFADVSRNTYQNNICINVSDSQNGTYTPYKTDTLSLSTPVTLRSAGSVAEVLTLVTGKKTRPIGSVDLGTLNWTSLGDSIYQANISGKKNASLNLICALYPVKAVGGLSGTPDKTIGVKTADNNAVIVIHDSSYSDAATFKTAMSGIYLNYELATPLSDEQVCDPVPDNFLEVEGDGTVETIQTQSPVIDNCLDVTYDIIPQ